MGESRHFPDNLLQDWCPGSPQQRHASVRQGGPPHVHLVLEKEHPGRVSRAGWGGFQELPDGEGQQVLPTAPGGRLARPTPTFITTCAGTCSGSPLLAHIATVCHRCVA